MSNPTLKTFPDNKKISHRIMFFANFYRKTPFRIKTSIENPSILGYTYFMTNVNQTLFIPLYGKAKVSKQGIILKDSMAEKIWDAEAFAIHGKSKSKWLTYNMAMRAKIFDDWVEKMLAQNPNALVLHIGCGLDSRAFRIAAPYSKLDRR